jgi:hypothetical protein
MSFGYKPSLRMNYPLGYPHYLLAVAIYIVFENKGSESYRKKHCIGASSDAQKLGKQSARVIKKPPLKTEDFQ